MLDVHVHVGEGGLLPAEAMRMGRLHGYRAMVLLCRVDTSNLSLLLPWLLQMCQHYTLYAGVEAFAGVEIVQVPPPLIFEVVAEARAMGAGFVGVHGETPADSVELGTNLAAIQSGADVLLHPGIITLEDAQLAAENGVALEITSAPGHCLANAHVAAMAEMGGGALLFGGNVKKSSDFVSQQLYDATLSGALLSSSMRNNLMATSNGLLQRLMQG